MADELLRSRHVFGGSDKVADALLSGKIDAFDILFLDGDTEPKIGWIDKEGTAKIVDCKDIFALDVLPESGTIGKLYLVGTSAYVWTGEKFAPLAGEVTGLDEATVNEKISVALSDAKAYTDEKVADVLDEVAHSYEKVKYEVSYKPTGTIIDYREKE